MLKTLVVTFDGEVFRPEGPVDLAPSQRYRVAVQPLEEPQDAWDLLEVLSGTVEASPDWAEQHDHYLYGSPKRASPRA